jgi:hypothetical protein
MEKPLPTIDSLSFEEIGSNWALRKLHGFRISNNKLSVNLPTVY